MALKSESQSTWRVATLMFASVSFAVSAVFDLSGLEGPFRVASVWLSIVGFLALGASTVAIWVSSHRRRRRHRATAVATVDVASREPTGTSGAVAPLASFDAGARQRPEQMPASEASSARLRLAGKKDLARIAEAGKDAIGSDFFYDAEELESYIHRQRDSILCLERQAGGRTEIVGYAILLALKPVTVERIKSGEIAFGRHILSTDIAESIEDTDAIYLSMIHGFDSRAQLDLGVGALRRIMMSHRKRRPQLVLAREGTRDGRRGMDRLGFATFGDAPFIEAMSDLTGVVAR